MWHKSLRVSFAIFRRLSLFEQLLVPRVWPCEGPRFRMGEDMDQMTNGAGNWGQLSVPARRQLDDAERLLRRGDITAAQDACREILNEYPEYVGALYTFGCAYIAGNNPDSALPCFVRASMLSPEDPAILTGLAGVYCELQADEAALDASQDALKLDPDAETAASAHLVQGRVLERASDYAGAREHLEKALALKPGMRAAALLLGACHTELGDQDAAATAYAAALNAGVPPLDHAQMLYDLAQRPKSRDAKKLLSQIDSLGQETSSLDTPLHDVLFRGRLELARARIFEDLGQHGDAWQALEAGNAPLREGYLEANRTLQGQTEPTIARARDWNYAGPSKVGDGTDVPVTLLILGASRSGKSLLERLVGAMTGVVQGSESELVQNSVAHVSNSAKFLPLFLPGQLPATLYENFSKTYMSELDERAKGAKLFTTTHPGLIPDLGRVAELVPNVRIVFIERNRDDTAHRIYGKMYPQNTNPFAYDVSLIDEHLDGYAKLIEAWSGHLGDVSMRVTYEDMVADPKATLAKVAELCGQSVPKGKLPEIGDDRGCAAPYLEFLNKARA